MGITGKFVEKFSEANLATAVDVHMNDDCPKFFDVVSATTKEVALISHHNGKEIVLPIRRRLGSEWVTIEHVGVYEAWFQQGRPTKVKIVPFKGIRT